MALRRIFFQLGSLASAVAFAISLFHALNHQVDPLVASLRAVGAGVAVVLIAMALYGLMKKLEEHE